MKERKPISGECVERLHVWVQSHCPCLLEEDDGEFMAGLFVIVEEEVIDALRKERTRFFDALSKSSKQ